MPWLRTVSIDDPAQRLAALEVRPRTPPRCCSPGPGPRSRPGSSTGSTTRVRTLLADDPWEWRAVWMSGLVALARHRTAEAQGAFNAVYGQVPGELAPKLALALACETGGDADVAESLYMVCARTDANYVAPAAFGLARIRAGRGDVDGAVAALDLVPATSRAFTQARRRRAGLLAGSGGGLPSLAAALDSIESLTIDPRRPVALPGRGARPRRWASWSRTVPTPRSSSVDGPRPSRPCATGSRRPTATSPATPRAERSAPTSSTRPTRSADGRCV